MLLTREKSLQSPPLLKTQTIPVPEFGEDAEIAVRGLTARQRWAFGQMASKSAEDASKGPEPSSYLIAIAAIDGDGHTLFQAQDADNIAEWPGDLVDRVSTVIMEMSGLGSKESGKDDSTPSEPTPSGSGPTESPETSPAP